MLDVIEILLLIKILFTTVPFLILLFFYYQTRMVDFLIFSGIPFFIILNNFTIVVGENWGPLSRRIEDATFFLGLLMVFLHAIRIQWQRSRGTLIKGIGYTWILVMFALILSLRDLNNIYYLITAHSFRIFIAMVVITIYSSLTPMISTPRIQLAKQLWITTGILNLVSPVVSIIEILLRITGLELVTTLINLGGLVTVLIIAIFIPEAILISRIQFTRIMSHIYKSLLPQDEPPSYPRSQLQQYINLVESIQKNGSRSLQEK